MTDLEETFFEFGLDGDDDADMPAPSADPLMPSFDLALHAKARITKMDSLVGVRIEMSKLYRYVRRGQLSPDTGLKMVRMLTQIANIRKVLDVEKKVDEIHAFIRQVKQQKGKPNGVAQQR